jgi:hypothetical protein
MPFPYTNAQSVSRLVANGVSSTVGGFLGNLPTGQYNVFSVPGVVDVSGMEFSMGLRLGGLSGTPGLSGATDSASSATMTFSDGGPTGDATGAAALFTAITDTAGFVARVPRDVAGTSSTDLDADDWVNWHLTINPNTTDAGAAMVDLVVAYIYGKPGAIN